MLIATPETTPHTQDDLEPNRDHRSLVRILIFDVRVRCTGHRPALPNQQKIQPLYQCKSLPISKLGAGNAEIASSGENQSSGERRPLPMAKSKRKRAPKTVLKLPDLEQSKSAVLNSLTSSSSKRSYDHAIHEFIDWYCSEPRLAFCQLVKWRSGNK